MLRRLLLFIAPWPLTGCVQRVMTVQTDPPGAVVYLNDREAGRTPFSKPFLWYGNYDVVVRKDGYQTLKTTTEITAPFWQWVPLDAITDFIPLRDEETMNFALKPDLPSNPIALLAHGEQLRQQLESSEHTIRRNVLNIRPATRPATDPMLDDEPAD